MAYRFSVACGCVRDGRIQVPDDLVEHVRVTSIKTYGPSLSHPLAERFTSWKATACEHPGLVAAEGALANNHALGRFFDIVGALAERLGDPALEALAELRPMGHGVLVMPDQAARALPGLARLAEVAGQLSIAGVRDLDTGRVVWWAPDPPGTLSWLGWTRVEGTSVSYDVQVDDGRLIFRVGERATFRARRVRIGAEREDGSRWLHDLDDDAEGIGWWPWSNTRLEATQQPLTMAVFDGLDARWRVALDASVAHDQAIWLG